MNLFLVTSPFQLICALEAKHHYKTINNILILREEKGATSQAQTQLLLQEKDWDHIIHLGRRSKVWEVKKLLWSLKRLCPSMHFQNIFYADYSAWRTAVLMNNITVNSEVMFDDGVGTVREFKDKIHPRLEVSRNKKSRDRLLAFVGVKPPRLIYPRNNFSFFTFFDLPGSEFPIEYNTLSTIRKRLNTDSCFQVDAPAGFIGQGMVAEKGINLDHYCELLKQAAQRHTRGIIYFPHRTEADFVKQRIQDIPNVMYHNATLPLELEIAHAGIQLSAIYNIASTAGVTIGKIYPTLKVFDIVVPVEEYLIEEFGQNFHTVSRALGMEKADFS